MEIVDDQTNDDEGDEYVLELLTRVIKHSYDRIQEDCVGRALLYFLVRVSNTWRSIRTLRNHTPDDEGFAVDAGMLLRAMFDAYLQAEFIVHDPENSNDLARDYLDFEHVERFKRARAITSHDNPLSDSLKSSPRRSEGEERLQQEYDRVKARYFLVRKQRDGNIRRGPGTRNKWYSGDLAEIARTLDKADEYDILLANFHGCVHSSSYAVRRGPVISPEHFLDWASTIAARLAELNVKHHAMELADPYQGIMEELCKPYF